MSKKKHPARKPRRASSKIHAGLIIRLCAALRRATAQRDWDDWRRAIIRAAFSGQHQDYCDTGNPLHLLNGLVTARRAGVPVPEWVLQPLTAAIEMVLADKGRITLDEALGLKPDQGQGTQWQELDQHEHDARLKWLLDQELKKGLQLYSDKAGTTNAVAVVATIIGLDSDKHDSLRQAYQRRLKKHSSRLSK